MCWDIGPCAGDYFARAADTSPDRRNAIDRSAADEDAPVGGRFTYPKPDELLMTGQEATEESSHASAWSPG